MGDAVGFCVGLDVGRGVGVMPIGVGVGFGVGVMPTGVGVGFGVGVMPTGVGVGVGVDVGGGDAVPPPGPFGTTPGLVEPPPPPPPQAASAIDSAAKTANSDAFMLAPIAKKCAAEFECIKRRVTT